MTCYSVTFCTFLQVRQYAAVLLRRRVVKQWTKLTPEVHTMWVITHFLGITVMMHWHKTVVSFKVIYSRTSLLSALGKTELNGSYNRIMFETFFLVATFIVSSKRFCRPVMSQKFVHHQWCSQKHRFSIELNILCCLQFISEILLL